MLLENFWSALPCVPVVIASKCWIVRPVLHEIFFPFVTSSRPCHNVNWCLWEIFSVKNLVVVAKTFKFDLCICIWFTSWPIHDPVVIQWPKPLVVMFMCPNGNINIVLDQQRFQTISWIRRSKDTHLLHYIYSIHPLISEDARSKVYIIQDFPGWSVQFM